MKNLTPLLQKQFNQMQKSGKLFRVKLTGQEVWDLYINSFEPEHNPIFRDPLSSSHSCNNCKNFIRRYGNIVSINEDLSISTIFDISAYSTLEFDLLEYANPLSTLIQAITKSSIAEVFFETFQELNSLPYESCSKNQAEYQLGINKNVKRYTKGEAERYGVVKANEIREFHHFNLKLNKEFVDQSGKSVDALMSDYRSAKEVFQRGMETIPLDTLNLVRDLINQESLLDGKTHLFKVEKMIELKKEYDLVAAHLRDNWCWVKSFKFQLARFRNELIGVLCSELAEGKELNSAALAWNKRVDPANYMKAKAPITQKQINEAKKFVQENGYEESFDRRLATIDDIKVSEILHSNVGKGEIKSVSIFDGVKPTSTRHKRSEFDGVEDVTIDKFMKDILPTCSAVELYLTNNQKNNFVSLTTAKNKESKPIFKWGNNYSWTFAGNLAGKSELKEAVKSEGGKVDGVLRFSISWNENGDDEIDLDAHAQEPHGTHIYFPNKGMVTSQSGMLDVDMICPPKLGVENITWGDLSRMKDGTYVLWVHNYSNRATKGFKAEIEFDGEMYSYTHNKDFRDNVQVAEVILKNGQFSIKHLIPESESKSIPSNLYNLNTLQFHKVNLVCLSPNHWNGESVGNKFYFFMLDGCKSPTSIRSFHSENLKPELADHRKVFEILGSTNMIEPQDVQLSGLGFNATVRDEAILKLSGTHKRVIKVKF